MGAGDVKFAAVLGAWLGWKLLIPIWILSCFFSIIHGVLARSLLRFLFEADSSMKNVTVDENRKFIPYVT